MRLCPSVEGAALPLITHRIGTDVCLARQAANFHKCHRCVYRGQAADWEPAAPLHATVSLYAAGEVEPAAAKQVVIPRPAAAVRSPRRAAANG